MAAVAVIVLLFMSLLWILSQGALTAATHSTNHTTTSTSRGQNAEKLIIEEILSDHSDAVRYSRPVLNVTRPVWVSFGLVLSRVLQFDEQKELLTFLGWSRTVWLDEYLPWNASVSGVGTVRVPADRVWTPDIHSYNGLEKTIHIPDVILSADGLVLWVTQKEYGVPCTRNTLNKIEWTCKLRVSSTTFDGSKLVLNSMWHSVDLSSYESHGHIRITETVADRDDITWPCCAQPYPSPSIAFTMVINIQ